MFGDGLLKAEVIEVRPDGNRIVRFEYDGVWEELLDKLGEMPLQCQVSAVCRCQRYAAGLSESQQPQILPG